MELPIILKVTNERNYFDSPVINPVTYFHYLANIEQIETCFLNEEKNRNSNPLTAVEPFIADYFETYQGIERNPAIYRMIKNEEKVQLIFNRKCCLNDTESRLRFMEQLHRLISEVSCYVQKRDGVLPIVSFEETMLIIRSLFVDVNDAFLMNIIDNSTKYRYDDKWVFENYIISEIDKRNLMMPVCREETEPTRSRDRHQPQPARLYLSATGKKNIENNYGGNYERGHAWFSRLIALCLHTAHWEVLRDNGYIDTKPSSECYADFNDGRLTLAKNLTAFRTLRGQLKNVQYFDYDTFPFIFDDDEEHIIINPEADRYLVDDTIKHNIDFLTKLYR